jgi:hypothetical protein
MGMYDTVWVNCPKCGEPYDMQTKIGECRLHEYSIHTAPLELLLHLSKESIVCPKCNTLYNLVVRTDAWVSTCAYNEDMDAD